MFWQNIWAHAPSARKRASDPIRPSLFQSNPTSKSNVTANNNCIHINSANTSRKRTDWDQTAQKDNNNNKEARWYAIFVHVNNVLSNPKKIMPISINNSIPSISLLIGIL